MRRGQGEVAFHDIAVPVDSASSGIRRSEQFGTLIRSLQDGAHPRTGRTGVFRGPLCVRTPC
jgi:hypothetical protein